MSKAMIADASATISFTRRLGPALIDEFLDKIVPLLQVWRDNFLRFSDRLFPGP